MNKGAVMMICFNTIAFLESSFFTSNIGSTEKIKNKAIERCVYSTLPIKDGATLRLIKISTDKRTVE